MLTSIWEDVKRQFSYGNMVTRLIIVNVAVYIIVNIVYVLFSHGQAESSYTTFIHWLAMSSDLIYVLIHPWIVLTNMFLHEGFMHILWNMLILYWFGRILGDLLGDNKILPLYLFGGFMGALVYFLSANLLPPSYGIGSWALGASAGVMAIVVASGVLSPDYSMHLLVLGPVKLKYIVGVLVFLDIVGTTASNPNAGGAFAHLGGAFTGWFFISQLHKGKDWFNPINKRLDAIGNFFQNFGKPSGKKKSPKTSKVRLAYKNKGFIKGSAATDREIDLSHQEKLDAILEKIKKSSYDSLTEEEKEFLFKASKK
ncbi:MAG: membrane associated rhomboid family serine protease [Polaribacter sp.]|jgi:membrane associated rhomboid family serine protease